MKTNKLGIPISNNKDNINGNSINKNIYANCNESYIHTKNIVYYRLVKLNKPYIINLYGICIKKMYKE